MASVNDIGVPGQPMSTPPLTPWQAAVRAALNNSDVTVDARITAAAAITTTAVTPGAGWTNAGSSVSRQGKLVMLVLSCNKTTWAAGEVVCTVPAGYRPSGTLYFVAVAAATGAACAVNVSPATGEVKPVLALTNGGGLLGSLMWMTSTTLLDAEGKPAPL